MRFAGAVFAVISIVIFVEGHRLPTNAAYGRNQEGRKAQPLLVFRSSSAGLRHYASSQASLRRRGGWRRSRFVVTAFMRSCDDTAKAQEDRMNAATTNLSHAVVYIDSPYGELSMWNLLEVRA